MRLFFLDPTGSPAINVSRLRKSGFNISKLVASNASTMDAMIVLGDGTPDDQVIGVIAYHMNGSKIVGVVKPKSTNLGAADQIKTYFKPKIRKIMFVVDQDDLQIDEILADFTQRISETGITICQENVTDVARTKVCHCSFATRNCDIILVINGISSVPTEKHTIEDHLIQIGNLEDECRELNNSKRTWKSLSKTDKENIFRQLLNHTIVTDNFPQQVVGISNLIDM